jgi:hypothetical protein
LKTCRCFKRPCICCGACFGRGIVLVAIEQLFDDDGVHEVAIGYRAVRCYACRGTGERKQKPGKDQPS